LGTEEVFDVQEYMELQNLKS